MAEDSYRIVFRGELVEGVSRAEAEANLVSRFKYSEAALAKLFTGKGVVLKGGLDQATAEKYEKVLAGVGLVCEIVAPETIEVAEPAQPSAETEAEPEVPAETVVAAPGPFVEPAPAASMPVQEEIAEPAAAEPPEPADVTEDVFAPVATAPEEAPDDDESWAPVAAPVAAGDVFETEQAPASAAAEASFFEESPEVAGSVTAVVLDILQKTKPWVRLISILLFISSGLGMLAIAGLLIVSTMGGMGLNSDTPTLLMLSVQLASLLLYLIPAYYLFKYASAIGNLLKGGGQLELETALNYQKSFWRFSGILALILLVLMAFGILAAVLIPSLVG